MILLSSHWIRLAAALLLGGAALGLSGCDETVAGSAGSTPQRVADAGKLQPAPTKAAVTTDQAMTLFKDLCVQSYPSKARFAAAAQRQGFAQNASGDWYHPKLDASARWAGGDGGTCGMLIGSRQGALEVGTGIAIVATRDGQIGADAASGVLITKGPAGSKFSFVPVGKTGRYYFAVALSKD